MKHSTAPASAPVQFPTTSTQQSNVTISTTVPNDVCLPQPSAKLPPADTPSVEAIDTQVSPPLLTPTSAHQLPSPKLMSNSTFKWGDHDSSSFSTALSSAYLEIVHWKKNIFQVPLGKVGRCFVMELARLFRAYAEESALEQVALKAVMVISVLALQKPSRKAKTKELNTCLERRMGAWAKGDIAALLKEGRCLQQRLPMGPKGASHQKNDHSLARSFSNLMFRGKTSAALDLLSNKGAGGVLHVTDPVTKDDPMSPSVLDVLKSKHPAAQPASLDALLSDVHDPPSVHPVIFDSIDASSIRSAALSTKGTGGPSGLDAHCWRRLCTSFHSASKDLCHSLALLAR